MNKIDLEILEWSHWEHFKAAHDLSRVLPLDHPKRKAIEKSMNELSEQIKKIKDENKEK